MMDNTLEIRRVEQEISQLDDLIYANEQTNNVYASSGLMSEHDSKRIQLCNKLENFQNLLHIQD